MPPASHGSTKTCLATVARRFHAGKMPGDSTAERFVAGDYATVARRGGEQEWQTYAALGIIGRTAAALAGLARFTHPEAVFYSAVAHWIGGEEEAAERLLERVPTDHARNLLALLRKPYLDVLSQWPWRRSGCTDLLTGSRSDSRFRVRNISFHSDDLPNKPYADVRDFLIDGAAPDFYICSMVEWHLLPPNLQQLPCPVFGQTADYDLHIQTVYPWLSCFDALLVTDPSEWRDVSQLFSGPVYTFPKSFGIPNDLPPLPHGPRDTDVYLSGTLLHPYHPDKARLLHQLLNAEGLQVQLLNGFANPCDYHKALATSKVCITYVRHPTALPTRGLEALAMGCALLVQEDSVLTLFAGDKQGVRTYRLEQNNIAKLARSIVQRWPQYSLEAEAGARFVRHEFSLEKVASQYLRFLTFLAARPRGPRTLQNSESLTQKRCVLEKGWLPSNESSSPVLLGMAVHNERRLKARVTPELASAHALLDLAREAVLVNCHRAEVGLIPARQWLTYLRKIYREACDRFPDSLVARFNAIRVMLHFGTDDFVAEALLLLDETLQLPAEQWRIDPMEDVFPWDFFPQFFNYREYFDCLTAHLTRGMTIEADLCRLLRASLHAYRGFYPQQHGVYSQSLDDYQVAAALDPAFPYYRLWYAEQLLRRNLEEDRREAADILLELADHSLVFQKAFALLERCGDAISRDDRWKCIARRTHRAEEALRMREPLTLPELQPDVCYDDPLPVGKHIHRRHADTFGGKHSSPPIIAEEGSRLRKLRRAWRGLRRCLGLDERNG